MAKDGIDGDRAPEVVLRQASPLATRLSEFRDGDDKPGKPQASTAGDEKPEAEEGEEKPEGDEEVVEGEETQEEDEETEETEAEKGKTEGEDDEEVEEEDADQDAAKSKEKLFTVDIPTVGADKEGTHAAMLRLEGVPQEFRDHILGHVKRSQQLDGALQRLDVAREKETVARFYETDPLNAVRLVAIEHPELAQEFVSNWVLQNPKTALAIVKAAKLENDDPEKLELRGKVAERDMRDALAKAYGTLEAQSADTDFEELARDTVAELVDPLQLEGEDQRDFVERAVLRVRREMTARREKRMSPYLSKTELVELLQPLVQKVSGAAPNGKAPAGKKPLTKAEMAARQAKADQFRRLQPGASRTGIKPSGTKKTRLPRDMGERIKLLRANKL